MPVIPPTVGRVVWYYPLANDALVAICSGPLAAIVARVWTDNCVNLAVIDGNGNTHGRTSVLLVQDDEPNLTTRDHCTWMPYQKGQAAKTEAAEKLLADAGPGLWVERLEAEARDLGDRRYKLGHFITGDAFTSLPVESQALLRTQELVMGMYAEVLSRRLALIRGE